jgi:hypothetical protein
MHTIFSLFKIKSATLQGSERKKLFAYGFKITHAEQAPSNGEARPEKDTLDIL